jgi:hypothetical protein
LNCGFASSPCTEFILHFPAYGALTPQCPRGWFAKLRRAFRKHRTCEAPTRWLRPEGLFNANVPVSRGCYRKANPKRQTLGGATRTKSMNARYASANILSRIVRHPSKSRLKFLIRHSARELQNRFWGIPLFPWIAQAAAGACVKPCFNPKDELNAVPGKGSVARALSVCIRLAPQPPTFPLCASRMHSSQATGPLPQSARLLDLRRAVEIEKAPPQTTGPGGALGCPPGSQPSGRPIPAQARKAGNCFKIPIARREPGGLVAWLIDRRLRCVAAVLPRGDASWRLINSGGSMPTSMPMPQDES